MKLKKLNTLPENLQSEVVDDPIDNSPDEPIQDINQCEDPFEDAVEAESTIKPVIKKKKSKEFYVSEKDFEEALHKYYDTDILSPSLADMIRKMINGLAHRPNFINYTFRDEACGDALVNIMAALKKRKYKFGKSKPFSYFNAIAWNCWRNRIKREARQRNALAAYQDEVYGASIVQQRSTINHD
jgi:hypothetical protein